MPLVGFEPTITVFERTKAVRALDGAPTVIGTLHTTDVQYIPTVTKNILTSNVLTF
jgi:hypothetical protein